MAKPSHKRMALAVAAVVAGMVALTYASVPLYSLFCKVTGYGGTPKIAEENTPLQRGTRKMQVRFNADIAPELDWAFAPVQTRMEVITGERELAFFTAENLSDEAITGVATYNVTPQKAAPYLNKIQCFCFDKQTLQPHEKMDMPVSFFIDPAIEDDPYLRDVSTVTLSYTFFVAK